MTDDAGGYLRELDGLQARLGRFFRDRTLLVQALTHPSAVAEEGRSRLLSYERLEFLGDALVNAYLARLLFDLYPNEDEGGLTRLRAFWISQPSLAAAAREVGVGACLRLGVGEERTGGREKERVLASALEALFAAIYLDSGNAAGFRLARCLWGGPVRKRGLAVLQEDAKTALQEARQAKNLALPEYRTSEAGGGFESTVYLDGVPAGSGRGVSRKAAEQAAARATLERKEGESPRRRQGNKKPAIS
jgi:ribonuclease-3